MVWNIVFDTLNGVDVAHGCGSQDRQTDRQIDAVRQAEWPLAIPRCNNKNKNKAKLETVVIAMQP